MQPLGHNENDVVYCGLCDWSRKCTSLEQIEFYLQRHLADVHNRRMFARIENESGVKTSIPQMEEGYGR